MAEELNDARLAKLTTPRLLALFKSVRRKAESVFDPEIDWEAYKERIKLHLDNREHVK